MKRPNKKHSKLNPSILFMIKECSGQKKTILKVNDPDIIGNYDSAITVLN